MRAEIEGIPLTTFEHPTRVALGIYQESTRGLSFDLDAACKLSPTPGRSNSARSMTDVLICDKKAGDLYVIAFKPGDGTGSEVDYSLENLQVDPPYPRKTLIVPRNKTGVYAELHFAIASQKIDDVHAGIRLFGGTFDLLGLDEDKKRVLKIGELGNPEYMNILEARATYTVGPRGSQRFGDPHAVYSSAPNVVQVCAFWAINEKIYNERKRILHDLNPKFPV